MILSRSSMIQTCISIIVVGFISIKGLPQNKEIADNSEPIFRSNVSHVLVDIVVRDSNGANVGNLKADSFTVYDNRVAQRITAFSQENVPLDVALVVDNSTSVNPYVLQLQHSALTVLNKLDLQKDRIALFSLGIFPVQLTGLTSDLFLLTRTIAVIPNMNKTNTSKTNIKDALYDAAQYLKEKSGHRRRAIILISDNRETSDWIEHDKGEVLKELLESSVTLYSIKTEGSYSANGSSKDIEAFIEETGGEIVYAKSTAQLTHALDAILESLKHACLLGFDPSDPSQDGSYHKIAVKLTSDANCKNCRIQARKGYYNKSVIPSASRITLESLEAGRRSRSNAKPFIPTDFPFSLLLPSATSGDVLAPMTFKFWRSNMSGHGNTMFERYVNMFKDSLNSDPKIQNMLTHHFLPDSNGKQPAKFAENRVISFQENLKFYPEIDGEAADYAYDKIYSIATTLSIIPSELTPKESIHFALKSNNSSSDETNDKMQLDLTLDTAALFFYFVNEQHKCLLMLLVSYDDHSKSICQFVELNFSEEKFRQILFSGMPLSLKVPRAAAVSRITLTIFDPFSFTCGIQPIQMSRKQS